MIIVDESYTERKKKFLFNLVKKYNAKYEGILDDDDNKGFYIYNIDENKSIEENFCSNKVCLKCGGCCKTCPCVFAPEDFLDLNNEKYLEAILDTGLIGLYSYNRGIILRPRGRSNKDTVASSVKAVPFQNGYYNECIFLGKSGCMLPAECRPTEGLLYYVYYPALLEHTSIYTTEEYLKAYEKYNDLLIKLYNKYSKININIRDLNESQVKEKIDEVVKKITLKP